MFQPELHSKFCAIKEVTRKSIQTLPLYYIRNINFKPLVTLSLIWGAYFKQSYCEKYKLTTILALLGDTTYLYTFLKKLICSSKIQIILIHRTFSSFSLPTRQNSICLLSVWWNWMLISCQYASLKHTNCF